MCCLKEVGRDRTVRCREDARTWRDRDERRRSSCWRELEGRTVMEQRMEGESGRALGRQGVERGAGGRKRRMGRKRGG
jgi:hypothetical protein